MPLTDVVPDHVAVAVPAIDAAAARWHDHLGARWATPGYAPPGAGFTTRQLRFRGDAKLELLEPTGDDGFAHAFLARHGPSIHHVTLKVPALLPAVEQARDEGFDVVDVMAEGEHWHEAFLRPSQVGGLVVQLAWVGFDDVGWRDAVDMAHPEPAPDAPQLRGALLQHPDLDEVARIWTALGATVTPVAGRDTEVVEVRWDGAPLTLQVRRAERAGPVAIRIDGTSPLPPDPVHGAAVVPG
jgi:catechol 2,3-dioxygenase-like lactoylglutathione lyase family enzyme